MSNTISDRIFKDTSEKKMLNKFDILYVLFIVFLSFFLIFFGIFFVKKTGNLPVPLHLRNAPTKLMKDMNYGKNYQYAHDYKEGFVEQEFLPEEISGTKFYQPKQNATEQKILEELKKKWKKYY